jgi:hypothetical protein
VATCNNPTFIAGQPTRNHLAEIAPLPPTCDKAGQGPCGTGKTANVSVGGTGTGAAATPTPGASGAPSTGPTGAATGAVDPTTGQPQGSTDTASGDALAVPADLAAYRTQNLNGLLAPLAVLLLLIALVGPPVLARRLATRTSRQEDA